MAESESGIKGDGRRVQSMLKGKQLMNVERNHEWDANDWRWDGHLFIAKPLNPNTPTNDFRFSNSSGLNELSDGSGKIQTLEKRRKVSVDGESTLTGASLSLNIGGGNTGLLTLGQHNGISEGKDGKRSKPPLAVSSHPTCQVDDCKTDLRDAKDYHRRHKVCEMHAKSTAVTIGGITQRFCQQCSRFHMLQEFDEGKRSCKRRLEGHNRRRRKMNMQSVASDANPTNNEHINKCSLITVLRIISAMHPNKSEQKNDENLSFQLLEMFAGSVDASPQGELLRLVQLLLSPQSVESSKGLSVQALNDLLSFLRSSAASGSSGLLESENATSKAIALHDPAGMNGNQSGHLNLKEAGEPQETPWPNYLDKSECPPKQNHLDVKENDIGGERTHINLNNFDLNDIYTESQDEVDELRKSSPTTSSEKLVTNGHRSPPQSGNSDSCDKSPSTSSGELQCCTERIIFKLFGKSPSDIPQVLRSQILGWLSQSPTNIESYIRPGCIVLTIYVRLPCITWEELLRNLVPRLRSLLKPSSDIFWTTGWISAKVGQQLAFIYNGQVLLDRSFFVSYEDAPTILSVRPVAVPLSEEATFTVKGRNLTSGIKRLCCAFQGKQLIHEHFSVSSCDTATSAYSRVSFDCNEEIQSINFTCSFPNTTGRGFFEMEDQELNSGFLPFIVAEKDICSEVRMLEDLLEDDEDTVVETTKEINEALVFLHEFGWLLEWFRSAYNNGFQKHKAAHLSQLKIKWLLKFSVEHDWCAVLNKLLDILYDKKTGLTDCSIQEILDEIDLLHTAVKRKSGPMVKFLLNFNPNTQSHLCPPIFRIDKKGPYGVTPLHVAASSEGAQTVLDILTTGPEELWLHVWENERDATGFTPEGYAVHGGHDNYVQLIWNKKNKKHASGHLIIDLSNASLSSRIAPESLLNVSQQKSYGLEIDAIRQDRHPCKRCLDQSFYRTGKYRTLKYRPAILSMVAIAAVCVCVGILFKSAPEVIFVVSPFRWDALDYGYI